MGKKDKALCQIKIIRRDNSWTWLYKRGGEFLLIREQWLATRFTLYGAERVIEVLKSVLPGFKFDIVGAVTRPPKTKKQQPAQKIKTELKPKPKAPLPIQAFMIGLEPARLSESLVKDKLDLNSERYAVNEPVDCKNCGICRVCLDRMLSK